MEKNIYVVLSCIGMISSFLLGSEQCDFPRVDSWPEVSSSVPFPAEESFDRSVNSFEMNVHTHTDAESLERWASQTPEGQQLLGALNRSNRERLRQKRAAEKAIRQAETFFDEQLARQAGYLASLEQRVASEEARANRWQRACCGTGFLGTATLCLVGCLGYIG